MFDSISNLSAFKRSNGITNDIFLSTFVAGGPRQDYNHINLSIGEHVEACEENNYKTNSSNTRGTPTVALNPVSNSTGSYYFISLATGKRLNRSK